MQTFFFRRTRARKWTRILFFGSCESSHYTNFNLFVYLKGFFFPKLKSFCGYLKVWFSTLSDLLVTAWTKHGGTCFFIFLVFLIVGGGLIRGAFNFSKGTCFNEPRFSVNLLPLQRIFHWFSIEATFFFSPQDCCCLLLVLKIGVDFFRVVSKFLVLRS